MYSRPSDVCADFLKRSDKAALILTGSGTSISYGELLAYIYRGNHFFAHSARLPHGSTISFLFENCPEIIILNMIALLSGYRSCPLDAKRDTQEVIIKKLQQTETKIVFYRDNNEHKKLVDQIKEYSPHTIFYSIKDVADLMSVFGSEKKEDFPFFDKDNISLILYTSGTTGFPKGAMLSYENIITGTKQVKEWFEITESDVFYLVLPLHHINSTIFALSTLLAGGTLVIAPRYSRSRFFDDMAHYAVTMSSIVPTINLDLLEMGDEYERVKRQLRVKRIQIGSAPVSPTHTLAFYKKYGIRLIQGYGSTETSLRVTGVPVDLSDEQYHLLLSENSIGVSLSYNEVALIDKDGAVITQEGHEGELVVRGNNIMKGYLNNKQESEKALVKGMFYTGDMGCFKTINGRRFYYISGRIKEIIIKGGVNISPVYVEEQLRPHTAFARDVVVVGFPHHRFGEEVGVIVIPKDNIDQQAIFQFRDALVNKRLSNISGYETPQACIVAKDEEIAKTATGKVQHTKVRERFAQSLRLDHLKIGENSEILYRLIEPDEQEIMKEAISVHNAVFTSAHSLNEEIIKRRATNGFVIGGFDKESGKLVGVVTGFFGQETLLTYKKWRDITGDGTFNTAHPRGKVCYLCSVASVSSVGKKENVTEGKSYRNPTMEEVESYIESGKDFTPRFHFKPKGGFEKGARVRTILLDANKQDVESRGIVVLLQYPSLSETQSISFTSDKVGVSLIEAAMMMAHEKGKNTVVAVSRLGEAYKYFT